MTPVRLEPAAFRSRVKHSTTEPLRSLLFIGHEYISSRFSYETYFYQIDLYFVLRWEFGLVYYIIESNLCIKGVRGVCDICHLFVYICNNNDVMFYQFPPI